MEPNTARRTMPGCAHVASIFVKIFRQKMEEQPDDGDTKELRLEVKAGEEVFLEHLIRFCYSKQVTLTEGQLWVHFALCTLPKI